MKAIFIFYLIFATGIVKNQIHSFKDLNEFVNMRFSGKKIAISEELCNTLQRIITIPLFLTEELKEYASHLYGIMADERRFCFTKSYMEHEIIRGIKVSGMKKNMLHDIRHSHVSLLVGMGFTP